jgi:hypothetical protein
MVARGEQRLAALEQLVGRFALGLVVEDLVVHGFIVARSRGMSPEGWPVTP